MLQLLKAASAAMKANALTRIEDLVPDFPRASSSGAAGSLAGKCLSRASIQ